LLTRSFAAKFSHLNRFRQILSILIKYGFENILHDVKLDKYIDSARKFKESDSPENMASFSRWQRMRMVLEDLGPNFIKIGQILSNRPDLLPADLIVELSKLQDSSTPFPGAEAKQIIAEELGKPVEEIFKEFDDVPVASASVAQVHRAVLQDGSIVAVKVQRPGIENVINTDIEILLNLAGLLEKFVKGMDILNPVSIMEEYKKAIHMELDFVLESSHIEKFAQNFKDDDSIYVPAVYREHTTKKVLTMEYVDGIRFSDYTRSENGSKLKLIARRTTRLVVKQIFEYGYFHADPHPGNIFILNNEKICFLDYGLMGKLAFKQREQVTEMLMGIAGRKAAKIVNSLQKMTESGYIEDKEKLEARVIELLNRYAGVPLGEIDISNLFYDVINTLLSFRLKILPDFFLLIKSIIIMKGVINKLDPDYNIDEHLIPLLRNIFYIKHGNPNKMAEDFYASASDFMSLLRSAPDGLRELFEQIKRGKLTISIDYKGLDATVGRFEKTGNKVVISIIAAALLIGSSLIVSALIMMSKTKIPEINGISIGFIGLIIAAILGVFLLLSIIFKRP
jgi:ubiquinone biosynthesis protein